MSSCFSEFLDISRQYFTLPHPDPHLLHDQVSSCRVLKKSLYPLRDASSHLDRNCFLILKCLFMNHLLMLMLQRSRLTCWRKKMIHGKMSNLTRAEFQKVAAWFSSSSWARKTAITSLNLWEFCFLKLSWERNISATSATTEGFAQDSVSLA